MSSSLAREEIRLDLGRVREIFEGNEHDHLRMTDPFGGKTVTTIAKRVTEDIWNAHLRGETRIGFFPFIDGSRCKYAGWDIDTGDEEHRDAICAVLNQAEVPYQVETSKIRGWHVWLFCDGVPAKKLRRFGVWVIEQAEMTGIVKEFFPKQADPAKTGNALWCPFFGLESADPELNNGRSRFIGVSTGEVLDQGKVLAGVRVLKEDEVDRLLDANDIPEIEQSTAANLALDEIPDELPEMFLDLLKTDDELLAGWNGTREPPRDGSKSGFDAMLAGMLVGRGFTDVEVASILKHYVFGKGAVASTSYLARTVASAREFCASQNIETKTPSQADQLVQLALRDVTLFHDQTKTPYARIRIGDHFENLRCGSKGFRRWLARRMHEERGKAPNSEALSSALNVLEGMACFDGATRDLQNRVAYHEDAIWYDLTDERWRAVRIVGDGWQIRNDPPILFVRYGHQKPQVEPIGGGDIHKVFDFIPVSGSGPRLLLLVYLVACLVPDIPHPVPILHGPQGSGKTTAFRILRRLIDPSSVETLSFPRDNAELVQNLSHHWCPYFDNVTKLPVWQSDVLCRTVTGEGFTKRQLYTDDEDVVYSFRRCVGLNGINIAATKPDLLDRAILVGLDRIGTSARRTETDLRTEFEKARPYILGGMLDTLSRAMCLLLEVNLKEMPRMADFARWGCAITRALGQEEEDFMGAYDENIRAQNEEVIHADPVAASVLAFVDGRLPAEWCGTATQLLTELRSAARKAGIEPDTCGDWPSAPNALSRRLREVEPNLREAGIVIHFGHSGDRSIAIVNTDSELPPDDVDIPMGPNG